MLLGLEKRTIVSFGIFELDLDAGELRKAGIRVKLQGQPFRVLRALLARPGEVVTREELQREIWGVHTNVDFERGIAGAVNKIREALGDSADSPRYIETLARRGFRFIAPVRVEAAPSESPDLDTQATDAFPAAVQASSEALISTRRSAGSSTGAAAVVAVDALPAALPMADSTSLSLPAATQREGLNRLRLLPWLLLVGVALAVFVSTRWFQVLLPARSPAATRPPRIQQLTLSGDLYSGPPNAENFLTLVTDGPHIYTTEETGGRLQLGSMDLGGSPGSPIELPDELRSVSISDISRDGSRLLVRSRSSRDPEQPLWVVPTSGSTAFRLGEVMAHDATWMPDGTSILFAYGNELRILLPASSVTETYATLPGRAFWPRWSPDGKTLRFTLLDPITHVYSLWETTAQDPRPHRFQMPGLANMSLCCGNWTGDGRTYVIDASNSAGSDLWAISEARGHPATQLTNGPLRFQSPLPGRNGNTVYFVGIEQPSATRVYDEGRHAFVPAPPYLAQARRVTYSRDGQWLAWTDTSGRLWRARSADGSGRLQLSEEDLEVFLAHWAPNGRQLVMMARKPGETWKIYTVDSTGGVPRLLLSDTRNLADPDWSADGGSIVFGREADLMGKESGPENIMVLDVATHHVQPLAGSDNLFSPRWSPDGRSILALSQDQNLLRVFNIEHQTWRTLYAGGAADPVWSSDSRAIYFHAFASRTSAILRLQLSGETRVVSDLSQVDLTAVDNYFFGGITPKGAPIIEPKVGSGNLYSLGLPDTSR